MEETEKEVVKVKQEAEDGVRKKAETAHPAVKVQLMQQAASRGNPKKLVQPFLTFLRRNENDISRQLGQQQIAMREVRSLCDRVSKCLHVIQEEESSFYYRKHNNELSNAKIIETMKKLWSLTREAQDDIDEYTSWVFEGQDISRTSKSS